MIFIHDAGATDVFPQEDLRKKCWLSIKRFCQFPNDELSLVSTWQAGRADLISSFFPKRCCALRGSYGRGKQLVQLRFAVVGGVCAKRFFCAGPQISCLGRSKKCISPARSLGRIMSASHVVSGGIFIAVTTNPL